MKVTPLENKVLDVIRPAVADLGLDLVCVKITSGSDSQNVQIMAEDPDTKKLGIDDCTKLSKAVSVLLDVEDPINGPYTLEISSPGIDRPLIKLSDFEDYKGFEAKLETNAPTETGQKRFRGILKGVNGEAVLIETDQGRTEIPFHALSKAKLTLTDELIKATAHN